MNELYLAFSAIFKYKVKNTKYKEQKTKSQNIKIITEIQNAKKRERERKKAKLAARIWISHRSLSHSRGTLGAFSLQYRLHFILPSLLNDRLAVK